MKIEYGLLTISEEEIAMLTDEEFHSLWAALGRLIVAKSKEVIKRKEPITKTEGGKS